MNPLDLLNKVKAPEHHFRHTPADRLHDESGNFVGYRCRRCGIIWTPGGRWSQPGTKAHDRRMRAATDGISDKIRGLLDHLPMPRVED